MGQPVGSVDGEEVEVILMTDETLKGTTKYISGPKSFLNKCGICQTIKQILKMRTSSCENEKSSLELQQ